MPMRFERRPRCAERPKRCASSRSRSRKYSTGSPPGGTRLSLHARRNASLPGRNRVSGRSPFRQGRTKPGRSVSATAARNCYQGILRLYGSTVHTTAPMIVSFRDAWLERFYREDKHSKRIPADAEGRLFRELQLLDDATADADLRAPPSNHFEKLAGTLRGWHSIRVSDHWRLVFQWSGAGGEASQVYLDGHAYR